MRVGVVALAAVLALTAACSQPSAQHQATTTAPQRAPAVTTSVQAAPQASADAPPMENGIYTSHQLCGAGENDCPWKNWRTNEAAAVYERADPSAAVIANLAPGDWVQAIDGLTRFVPRRGVVRVANQGLRVGDVVYAIDGDGEGGQTFWRRGEEVDWQTPDDQEEEARLIQWDPQPANNSPLLGWWANVRLSSGKTGWVHDGHFECMGPIEGSDNCRG